MNDITNNSTVTHLEQTRIIDESGYRGYRSEFDRDNSYYEKFDGMETSQVQEIIKFKDKNTALFDKRWQSACEVIDTIAEKIEIDPKTCGHHIYGIKWNHETATASSDLADELDKYFNKSGEKVKLKKRISELEKENEILRTLARQAV
ncbi:MAG: hypothetical protein FWC13_07555 [Oscillospiraceae bacterium]|nr:hypothetical protein [Oscillospiraceae bacterium]